MLGPVTLVFSEREKAEGTKDGCEDFINWSLERMKYVKGGKFVQAARLVGKSAVGTPAGVAGEQGAGTKGECAKTTGEREYHVDGLDDAPPRAEEIVRSSPNAEPAKLEKKNMGHRGGVPPLDAAALASAENLEGSI